MGYLRYSVLALRVLAWVLAASMAVFVLASALGFAYERKKALHEAHAQTEEMVQRNLSAISIALWQFDNTSLEALLLGFVTSPVVVRAEVLSQEKTIVDVHQTGFSGTVDRVWSLPVTAREQAEPIGTLRISESYAVTQAQVMDRLGTLVVTDLIKIVGLALVLFVIVYRVVARHLSLLAKEVATLGNRTETTKLTLQRDHRSTYRDEIDVLVSAINNFLAERSASDEALRIAACAFESQQGILITDAEKHILRVNQAFTQITGYGPHEALGNTPDMLASGRHDQAFFAEMSRSLESAGTWAGEIWNRRKNGEIYPEWLSISVVKNSSGHVSHYVAVFNDISEQVRAQAEIATLAYYDQLTKLPNRRLLLDRLDKILSASLRNGLHGALLFIDLDNFKILNDTLGHRQGDVLLAQAPQRLKSCLRENDTVARWGGDEFVVLLEGLSPGSAEAAAEAEAVGDNILRQFEQVFSLELGEHRCTLSIGITLFGGGAVDESSEQPLKRAELAMFQAKAAGRNALRFFDTRMQAAVDARAALETDLREALARQQLELVYQPQVVGAGRVTGVEALLRWRHPQRGMVPPSEFIPLAEETGLILPIGQWVLEQACNQLAEWGNRPLMADLSMSVNVSARQFQRADFVQHVLKTLDQTHVNPRQLKLELTESMLVNDVEAIIGKMGLLKAYGVGFSLDDFGTGYSSLAYLKRLPLDQLKIDQGFVRNIVTDPNDAAIAKMVVVLAESLGLAVIAEGVELQAQADFLAHLGCHAYQGYLFSKPLSSTMLQDYVESSSPPSPQ